MSQEQPQAQQHIAEGVPFGELVAPLACLQRLFDFTDALPDPDRSTGRATEKICGDVEQCPAAVAQQCPAPLGVGLRLPVGEFGHGLGMGLEQDAEYVAVQLF